MKYEPLEDLLKEIKERKLLVNNLFQLDNSHWRCNLMTKAAKPEHIHFEFGDGKKIEEAVTNALYNMDVQLNYSQTMAKKKFRRPK